MTAVIIGAAVLAYLLGSLLIAVPLGRRLHQASNGSRNQP